MTGSTRKSDYVFSEKNHNTIGSFIESKGLLKSSGKQRTIMPINERLDGGIGSERKENMSEKRKKDVVGFQ